MAISFQCPHCGKRYALGDHLAGKMGVCKQCKAKIRIPASGGASSPAPAKQQPASSDELGLQQLAGLAEGAAVEDAARPCPVCGGSIRQGAVICVKCGYSFKSGGRLSTKVQVEPPPIPARSQSKPAKPAGSDGEGTSGWNSWALTFTLFAIGAPLLPLAGFQFRLLMIFGSYSPLMGIPCGVVAAVLWFRRGQIAFGVASIVASVIALVVAFSFAPAEADCSSGDTAVNRVGKGSSKAGTSDPEAQLKAEIEAEAAQIESLETEIRQLDGQIQSLRTRMVASQARIPRVIRSDADRARAEQGRSEYESLRSQYDALVSQRTAKSNELSRLANSVDSKVKRYNRP